MLWAWVASTGCVGGPAAPPVDLPKEPAVVADTPEAVEETPVVLRWSTATERECYGYHVYRGASVEGPFERLTKDVIPGGGNSNEVRSYQFEDREPLAPGTYFYFVEEIAMDGTAKRLTPPRPFDV